MFRALIIFCSLWAASLSEKVCYNNVLNFCKSDVELELKDCTACYGGFLDNSNKTLHDLQKYANIHVAASFDYLLLATNFGSYMKDRKGFEKLYRHLSDDTWEDAIDLIKYVTKRGGAMDFARNDVSLAGVTSVSEFESLGLAMDIHKFLAKESFEIHKKASAEVSGDHHEPEVASYLENKFLHKHSDTIRTLAGHVTDVKKMMSNVDQTSLSLFLFDEYLQEHSM